MKMFATIALLFSMLVLQIADISGNAMFLRNAAPENTTDAPVTAIGHITAEPGMLITTPVTVTGFSNIGAISLTMHYDPGVLTWQSYTNNSGFPGLFAFNPSPGVVTISGFTTQPEGFDLPDGAVLISFTFIYQTGSSNLTWFDNGASCEYAGPPPFYEPLNDFPTLAFYVNGSVSSGGQNLQGYVTYHSYDGAGLPLENINLSLLNNNDDVLASATTNAQGEYLFAMIPAGASHLKITSPLPWGGANATDALAIQQRSVAIPLPFWQPPGFIDQVADVNASNTVNATDALHVMQRSVGLISEFPAGDWAFLCGDQPLANTSGNSATMPYNSEEVINIRALCYGDVNGSYVPASQQNLRPVAGSDMIVAGHDGLIRLPVIIHADETPGAITLFMHYDTGAVIVHDIIPRLPGMLYNIDDGLIKVAWFDPAPPIKENYGNIFTLVIEAVNDIPPGKPLFAVCSSSEFAGIRGNRLENVVVEIPGMQPGLKSADNAGYKNFSLHCFPNPFGEVLNVSYELPASAQVTITLTGISGHPRITLFDQKLSAGSYELQVSPQEYGLTEGVYMLHMHACSDEHFVNRTLPVICLKTK